MLVAQTFTPPNPLSNPLPGQALNNTREHIEKVAFELRKKAPQDTFITVGIASDSFKGHLVYYKRPWNGLSATYEVSNGKEVWFGMYTGDESDFAIVVRMLRSLP